MRKTKGFAAAIIVCMFAALSAQAEDRWMDGATVLRAVKGKSFQQIKPTTGSYIIETFHEDGVVTFAVDGSPQIGRWKMDGNKLCTAWTAELDWYCHDIAIVHQNVIMVSPYGAHYELSPVERK
jgi:PII-like signaling protein